MNWRVKCDYRLMGALLLSSVDAAGLKLILFIICNSKGQSKQKIRIKSRAKLMVAPG